VHGSVRLEPHGVVYIDVRGDQDYQTVRHTALTAKREVQKLIAQHKPVKLFVRLDNIGTIAPSAVKATIQFLRKEPYDQVALFCPKGMVGFILMLIIDAVKDEEKLFICRSEKEARAWLNKSKSSARSSTRSA